MELTQDDLEILDRYFRNELTEDELKKLQTRLIETEFREAVEAYRKSLAVIEEAGRTELRSKLSSIQSEIEKTNGYDNYKSASSGKGFSGWRFFISIFIVIIAITAYLFYTGNLNTEKMQIIIPDSELPDTIYHYNINRDTIIKNKSDTISNSIIRSVKKDTVFIHSKISNEQMRDSVWDSGRN